MVKVIDDFPTSNDIYGFDNDTGIPQCHNVNTAPRELIRSKGAHIGAVVRSSDFSRESICLSGGRQTLNVSFGPYATIGVVVAKIAATMAPKQRIELLRMVSNAEASLTKLDGVVKWDCLAPVQDLIRTVKELR